MIDLTTPCLHWNGAIELLGYGRVKAGPNRGKKAHRVVYEALYGPVPDGLELDHVCHGNDSTCRGGPSCHHRACINPLHLEPVTRRVNALRGRGPTAINAAKTHCVNGHELDDANTYRFGSQRFCRACNRVNASHYKRRLREQRAQVTAP